MSPDEPDVPLDILTVRQRRHSITPPEIPTEEELLRDYTLSADDLWLVRRCRGLDKQVGFALQLCVLRRHGRFLTDFTEPPLRILNHRLRIPIPT